MKRPVRFVGEPLVDLSMPKARFAVFDWSGPDGSAVRPRVAGTERASHAAVTALAEQMNRHETGTR